MAGENTRVAGGVEMKRIDGIRNMTTEETAKKIIDLNITDKYCLGDCDHGNDFNCPNELECCVKWLESEVGEDG